MRHIAPLPHDDQKMIEVICKERTGWSAHQGTWLQALEDYKSAGGNPWVVQPAVFSSNIGSALENLYATRRQGSHIKKIREYTFTGSCPLCGSLGTGTVDHFLPKSKFPEFSIYSLNLIPACPYCNSAEKGSIYSGKNAPLRFLHPYFDKIADKPILSVAFKKPYKAVEISAIPEPSLTGDELEIVRFHIEHLLGDAFKSFVTNLWSTLPRTVADNLEGALGEVKPADTRAQIQWLLKSYKNTNGLNSWPTGFYRGVLADAEVIDYITDKTIDIIADKAALMLSTVPST